MSHLSRRPGSQTEWIIVYAASSDMEAHIVAGRLHHEGIPNIIERAIGAHALGISIGQLGEVRVLVHPSDYDQALEILEPEEPDSLPDSTTDITYYFEDDDE
jgi:hypothetical protein